MVMSSVQAKSFFGVIQRIYKLFSTSTKRWDDLKSFVKGRKGRRLTLKSWSDTRWKSRVDSVKAVRFQAPQIRDALLHLVENRGDATTASDARSLADYELQSFDFLVGIIIWFEILQKVNSVSKLFQRNDMVIGESISLLQGLIVFLEEYRNCGFEAAKVEAQKIASEMDVEPAFCEIQIRRKSKLFDENARDEPVQGAEEYFRLNYFLQIVDNALSSLQLRFVQFQKYEEIFGFLFNLAKLKNMDDESLKHSCVELENFLRHGDNFDIDALELFSELQLLRKALPDGLSKPVEVLEYIKNLYHGFPNAWVAYRILLTIPVTVASAERSFSKLKLIKNYLRSTMSQDRLNGLTMLSIEKKNSCET
ncbi:hAT dimerisation domain-containing protein / transposase-related [Striga hermonthica]|uniref:HAT dimerisation domain-containing protein / transposase-related n=1 Tax=Striga hermonthica TaxID=68872 RepID=A0A9N7N4Z7_STRHE|nr:hAT dimerisation domain-containing protein / transposase-related [Striga hermonthica]